MKARSGALGNFLLGVATTVIAGLALWWIQDSLKDEPELSWFRVASFQLDDHYASRLYELDSFNQYDARNQGIIAVQNTGSLAAKGVNLLLSRNPIGVRVEPSTGFDLEELNGELFRLSVDSVGSGSQLTIFLSGMSLGDIVRVEYAGEIVPSLHGSRLAPVGNYPLISLGRLLFWGWIAIMLLTVVIPVGIALVTRRASDDAETSSIPPNSSLDEDHETPTEVQRGRPPSSTQGQPK